MSTARIAGLAAQLRRNAFTPASDGGSRGGVRVGAEVELIPIDGASRRRCPIRSAADAGPGSAPATLPVLRRIAARQRWEERASSSGAPEFTLPDGGALSYEPGGQIEYSTPPCASVSALVARLRATVSLLCVESRAAGIDLLSVGLDPYSAIDEVPMQLPGPRYAAMHEYFAARGRAGARMMRQTAAFQVTLDGGDDPLGTWRVLSAAAPYVTAIFANSPRYAGRATGYQSARAHAWRTLDRARTGLPAANDADPASAYGSFALAAPAMLHRGADGGYESFGALLANGAVTDADWGVHLTTLFPEVRPRRLAGVPTFEARSVDAIPATWYPAPLVLLAGIVFDRRARQEATALLGPADPDLLACAACAGLGDPSLGPVAAELFELALRGATRLGAETVGGAELETAHQFAAQYTWRGRSPADDVARTDGSSRSVGARRSVAVHATAPG
jgi:glutamate--cysteine ligase